MRGLDVTEGRQAEADRAPSGVPAEGVGFLRKPFTRHDLAAKVRQALGNGE